ncbi:MAG TPA: hypothetical protein VEH82_02200, partial [Acidimicrobiales bacterium]|nr:hypothetical protein [Acidimicrobiales bacterium]
MSRPTRLIPIVVALLAGGAIAFAASDTSKNRSITTTVVEPSRGASLPTSLTSTTQSLTINQIYRQDGPGVVDI